MENKNPIIDIVKGIAILLVVYGHVIQNTMASQSQDFFLNPAFKTIYTFHMPLFVFISGYLLAFSLNRRNPGEVLITRYKSLLIPLVSWGVLGVITSYCMHISLTNPSIWFVWFLYTLFVSSCLLLLSVQLEKKIGIAVFFLIYLLVVLIPYNDFLYFYYIKWFYLFYLSGYFFNRYKISLSDKMANKSAFIVMLIFFTVLASYWTKNDYIYINKMNFLSSNVVEGISRMAYRYILGFLGIFIVFYIADLVGKNKAASFLGYLGIYSLDIYLIQRYIVEGIYPRFAARMHSNLDFNSPLFIYVFVPLVALFFTGLCVIISKLLIRKNDLLTRFLLGGRA